MSPSEFEFLIILIGEKISKKDTAFRKARSVWSSCWKIAELHTSNTNIIICGLWKKLKIRL